MKNNSILHLLILTCALLGAMPVASRLRAQATLTDLGNVSGAEVTLPAAINDSGQVVGFAEVESPSGSTTSDAYLYTNDGYVNLGTILNTESFASDINDSGAFVGSYNGGSFIASNGNVQLLPGSGNGYGINASGAIVGGGSPFIYSNGTYTYLPFQSNGVSIEGVDSINNSGVVAGYGYVGSGSNAVVFTYANGTATSLGSLAGTIEISNVSINNSGAVAGTALVSNGAGEDAFYDSGSGMINLNTLLNATISSASGINNAGQVVGSFDTASGAEDAFLYSASGGVENLNTVYASLLVSGGTSQAGFTDLEDATGINNSGEIVGIGSYWNGSSYSTETFVLNPEGALTSTLTPVTINWSGGASGNWSNAANWSGATVPNSAAAEAFITTANTTVSLDANETVGELVIAHGDTLNITDGKSLTVTDAGGFNAAGFIDNTGTINVTSTGDLTALLVSGNVELLNGGTVKLAGGVIMGSGLNDANPNTLVNANDFIEGYGTDNVGTYHYSTFNMTNETGGVIQANVSGQTLEIDAGTFQNNGTLEAINGGTLQFGPTLANFVTFNDGGGLIWAENNSTIRLGQTGTISTGTLMTTGSGQIVTPGNIVFQNVTNDGTLNGTDGSIVGLSGTFTNSGIVTVNSTGDITLLSSSGSVTLTGSGTINLTGGATLAGGDYLSVGGGSFITPTLDNINNTIEGGGPVNAEQPPSVNYQLINEASGTVNANVSGEPLVLNGQIENFGLLEASNSGTLQLGAVQNIGGTIEALNGSTVSLGANSRISGTLTTSGTGQIVGTGVSLSNMTNAGQFVASGTTSLTGAIVNSGTISVTGTTSVLALSGSTTLTGHGALNLSGAFIAGSSSGFVMSNSTVDNVDNTIEGWGSLPNPIPSSNYNLTNEAQGVVNANVSGQTLMLGANSVTNYGLLEASNGGTLQAGGVQNISGTIDALDQSTVELGSQQQQSMISGTLTTSGSGQIVNLGQANLSNVTNAGQLVGSDGSTTSLNGSIANTGTISVNSTGDATTLAVSGSTTLTGGGVVNLNGGILGAPSYYGSPNTLDNVNNTIQGWGGNGLHLEQNFDVTNEVGGTISANVSGKTLEVDAGQAENYGTLKATNDGTLDFSGSVQNQGTISVDAGSTVIARNSAYNTGTITLNGGTFNAAGEPMSNQGTIQGNGTLSTVGVYNSGSLTLTTGTSTVSGDVTNNSGATISVTQATATFTGNVTNSGTFTSTGSTITVTGTFTNNGALITDPTTFNLANLNIGTTGYILGGAGDVFNVTGNVTNDSTNPEFNISQASLSFQGAVNHTLTWSGASSLNFSINTLELAAGGSLTLNLASGDSLSVTNLDLLGGASQVADITINGGGTIYYDPTAAGNAYLNNQNYSLAGGGFLEAEGVDSQAVPEPSTWAMLAGGVGVLALLQRRRKDASAVLLI
jgi:probable HAF family extracellular repeat protein